MTAKKKILKPPQIRFKTEGFRAIASADIIIDGITVVAGENGSGKSTLSKLLYYLYKTVSNYELLVYQELRQKLSDIFRFLEVLQHEIYYSHKDRTIRDELRKELEEVMRFTQEDKIAEEIKDKLLAIITKIENIYRSQLADKNNEGISRRFSRLNYILREDIFNEKIIEEIDKDEPIPFERIRKIVEDRFKKALGLIKSRPNSLFIDALADAFNEGKLPKIFEVFEFDSEIVSLRKGNLSIPYSIRNAIYIDSPIMLGHDETIIEYWDDLNELIKKRGKSSSSKLSKVISKEIINGETSVDEDVSLREFSFKSENGSVYDLLDCATGIKAFAIIQLLLKNGSLSDKTLLIIDEPESNLHPQWIIEYARLIVLLHKEIGVKFFLASHNPDMVSALKYISMKEEVANNLNFYLAEKLHDNSYQYKYNHLGQEVDAIFKSFNIALERINQYGIE